ncbi:MAG: PhzF family phenazine biosynthesis protein [Deltaproteobacteria bacterium]|nr:PhzF family phenazine biosynthesis protein [Deltaproteobacteria bacterium]
MKIYIVDAFTTEIFKGNPSAICVCGDEAEDAFMQEFASEMNHSETAFLRELADGGFSLRWFTPATEVDLCGHATLASAHILWEEGFIEADETCVFHTRSGELRATKKKDGLIEMDFPIVTPDDLGVGTDVRREISNGIGAEAVWAGKAGADLLVELRSEADVEHFTPRVDYIKSLPIRGLIVTAKSERRKDADFVSRFFAPAYGIPEDPVTGSAHCALAPYWGPKLNKIELTGYQASKRGGYVKVKLGSSRVKLLGSAVTVMSGKARGRK